MTDQQPEALRLAGLLDLHGTNGIAHKVAAELRRLHAANMDCIAWCEAIKADNERLRAEMEAIGAGGVGPLMKSAHREQHFDMVPLPRPQVDLIIQELARYCNTGEMDDAESLLASLQFSLDPNQQPPTTERFLAVDHPQIEQERCHLCDCTGDIHGLDGEWRGECPYCRPQPPVVEQVPVAWVKPNWQADPWAHAVMDAQKKRDMAKSSADSMHRFSAAHTVPLYTHPQREPLTLEQIAVAFGWKKGCLPLPRELQATRAIERAHGIGGEA